MNQNDQTSDKIRSALANTKLRRTVWIVLLSLLLIMPTIFAVIYVYNTDRKQIKNELQVELYDSNGTLYAEASGIPDSPATSMLVTIFYNMTKNMKEVELLPAGTERLPHIRALITEKGVQRELLCYFSFAEVDSFCVDKSSGTYYSITASDTESFLSSSYAEPFYTEAKAPVLTNASGEVILPTNVSWTYKTAYGQLREALGNNKTSENLLYDVTGEIRISFSVQPTECLIQAYEKDIRVFNGTLEEFSSLTFDPNSELSVSIRAVWAQSDSAGSYGELSYSFRLRLKNSSDFYLSRTKLPAGGVTVLSCTNIEDPSRIRIESDTAIPSPVFHKDGAYWHALLPFPIYTEPVTISLRVTYGASTKTFRLEILPTNADANLYTTEISGLPDLLPPAIREWQHIAKSISYSDRKNLFFHGRFLNPTASGFETGYTHGATVYESADPSSFVSSFGSEYLVSSDADAKVAALHHGTVVATGNCTLLGNYAVVDHGGGLRTWYGGLSALKVREGDVVAQGETVGIAGDTGWTGNHGFLLICTVYETVIDPAELVGKAVLPDRT